MAEAFEVIAGAQIEVEVWLGPWKWSPEKSGEWQTVSEHPGSSPRPENDARAEQKNQ